MESLSPIRLEFRMESLNQSIRMTPLDKNHHFTNLHEPLPGKEPRTHTNGQAALIIFLLTNKIPLYQPTDAMSVFSGVK